MNEIPILNLLPERYRGWFLLAAWLLPYATRAAHSLRNGSGLVGAVRGILFGTNTPKDPQ